MPRRLVLWVVWRVTRRISFSFGASTTELADSRMVADPTKPKEARVNYRNAIQGVYRMVREEGASSLARGLAPNTVSSV